MIPIPIKHRETEQYALNQPDMLRVRISDGKIVTDRRFEYFGIHAPKEGGRHRIS
jgi:hypothetical protein